MTNKRLHKGIDQVIEGLKESGNDFHNRPSLRYLFRIFIRCLNLYVTATFFFAEYFRLVLYEKEGCRCCDDTDDALAVFIELKTFEG